MQDPIEASFLTSFQYFRFPESLTVRSDGPTAVIDWERFYETRDEDLDRWIGTRKLLSNREAVQTGLLLCKYFAFLALLLSSKFSTSLFVGKWGSIISMIIIFSIVRIGRGVDCIQPGARSPPFSTWLHLVVCGEDVV